MIRALFFYLNKVHWAKFSELNPQLNMEKKSKNNQDDDLSDHSIELVRKKGHYYRIIISPKNKAEEVQEKIFCSKMQVYKNLRQWYKAKLISARQLQKITIEVFLLDMPFMYHAQTTSEEMRAVIEADEKKFVVCDINEALAIDETWRTQMPQVVINRIPNERPEAYIITEKFRSDMFYTVEAGMQQANAMLSTGKIVKDGFEVTTKRVEDVFDLSDNQIDDQVVFVFNNKK